MELQNDFLLGNASSKSSKLYKILFIFPTSLQIRHPYQLKIVILIDVQQMLVVQNKTNKADIFIFEFKKVTFSLERILH